MKNQSTQSVLYKFCAYAMHYLCVSYLLQFVITSTVMDHSTCWYAMTNALPYLLGFYLKCIPTVTFFLFDFQADKRGQLIEDLQAEMTRVKEQLLTAVRTE